MGFRTIPEYPGLGSKHLSLWCQCGLMPKLCSLLKFWPENPELGDLGYWLVKLVLECPAVYALQSGRTSTWAFWNWTAWHMCLFRKEQGEVRLCQPCQHDSHFSGLCGYSYLISISKSNLMLSSVQGFEFLVFKQNNLSCLGLWSSWCFLLFSSCLLNFGPCPSLIGTSVLDLVWPQLAALLGLTLVLIFWIHEPPTCSRMNDPLFCV